MNGEEICNHPQPSLRKPILEHLERRRKRSKNFIKKENEFSIQKWREERKKKFPFSKKKESKEKEFEIRRERGEFFYKKTEWYEMSEANEQRSHYDRRRNISKKVEKKNESDSDDVCDVLPKSVTKRKRRYRSKLNRKLKKRKRFHNALSNDNESELSSDDMMDDVSLFKTTHKPQQNTKKNQNFTYKRRYKRSLLKNISHNDTQKDNAIILQSFRHIVENKFFQNQNNLHFIIQERLQNRNKTNSENKNYHS